MDAQFQCTHSKGGHEWSRVQAARRRGGPCRSAVHWGLEASLHLFLPSMRARAGAHPHTCRLNLVPAAVTVHQPSEPCACRPVPMRTPGAPQCMPGSGPRAHGLLSRPCTENAADPVPTAAYQRGGSTANHTGVSFRKPPRSSWQLGALRRSAKRGLWGCLDRGASTSLDATPQCGDDDSPRSAPRRLCAAAS